MLKKKKIIFHDSLVTQLFREKAVGPAIYIFPKIYVEVSK